MFQGNSEISMDAKGRIAIPTKFRDELLASTCQGNIVVTASIDARCLSVYPSDIWFNSVVPQVEALPSAHKMMARTKRLVIGYAETYELESNARVQLTSSHRKWGQFEKKLILVGLGKKYELWDADTWMATAEDVDDGDMPDAMMNLNI
jgi:MraZ protein